MDTNKPSVQALLLAAGWVPGRMCVTTQVEQAFQKHGIPCHAVALRFLAEFEGLTVRTRGGPFYFSALAVLGHLRDEDIPYLKSITGELLCPVGWGLFLFMLVAPNGNSILLDDNWRRCARFETPSAALGALFAPDPLHEPWVDLGEKHWPPGYRAVTS